MEKQKNYEALPVSVMANQLTISRMLRREIAVRIDKFLANANELLMDGEKTKDGFDKNFFISFLKQHEDEILSVQNKLLSGGMNIKNFGKQLNEFLKRVSEKDDSAQEMEKLNAVVNRAKDEINVIALMLKQIAAAKEFDEIDLPPNLEKTYNSLKERFEAEKIDTIRIIKTLSERDNVISGVLDRKIAGIKESIKNEINTAVEMAVTNIYDYIHEKIKELSKAIDEKIDESRKNTYASFEISTDQISAKFDKKLSKTAQEIIARIKDDIWASVVHIEAKIFATKKEMDVSISTNAEKIIDTLRKETFATGEIMTGRILSKFKGELSETGQKIIDKVHELLTREETDLSKQSLSHQFDYEKNKGKVVELLKKWIERSVKTGKTGKTRNIMLETAKSDLGTKFTHKMMADLAVKAGIIPDTKEARDKLCKDLWTLFGHQLNQTEGEFMLKKGKNEKQETCYWYEITEKGILAIINVNEDKIKSADPFSLKEKTEWVKSRTLKDVGTTRKLLLAMIKYPLVTKFTTHELSEITNVEGKRVSSYLMYIVKTPKGILVLKYQSPFWWLEENKASQSTESTGPRQIVLVRRENWANISP